MSRTRLPDGPIQTDQIHCYDAGGRRIDCANSGQDAARPKHSGWWDASRFRVEGECVHDRLTGAVWMRNANPAEFPLTWDEARAAVDRMAAQRAYGRDDWQLPDRRLLFSLVSHQTINPVLPGGHPFEGIFNGYYWTADTCQRLSDQAWYVHMGGGRIHRGMKHGSYMLWPVSAGAMPRTATPTGRLDAAPTGVYDNATGLTWHPRANLFGKAVTWTDALSAVERLNRAVDGGADDWRMPNIRELESLVDLSAHAPALTADHPFVDVQEGYWSSTTSVYEPRYAWVLYIMDGIVGVGYKPGPTFHVWPVRG